MANRDQYDWEAIKQDYRTGRFTLFELSRRHGPTRQAISKKARQQEWTKDLTDEVRQRTREKVSRATLPPEAQEALDEPDDEAIVEHAATENAAVVKGHRKMLSAWRERLEEYTALLGQQMASSTRTVLDREGNEVDVDVELDYVGKCMSYGTQALDRVVKLERQSYGLDESDSDDDLKTFDELMQEVAKGD
ncbi:hypothetical protein [Halomonas sp. NO4]|uniref:hypothetical protein n=1 Tax=Halomonas sp. NO4 TaxID=2484813 RepID=UPI0013D8C2D4|nr:hypothetical protein [Halomonas sp. NO4]